MKNITALNWSKVERGNVETPNELMFYETLFNCLDKSNRFLQKATDRAWLSFKEFGSSKYSLSWQLLTLSSHCCFWNGTVSFCHIYSR